MPNGTHYQQYHAGSARIKECLLCFVSWLYKKMDDLQDDRQQILDDKDRLKAEIDNMEIELDKALQSKKYF